MYNRDKDNKDYTDRIISKFPHMYNRDKDSNNYFLLYLYLDEIRQTSKSLYDLLESLNILNATGYLLDKFGDTFNLKRNSQEKDDDYRQRILSELVSQSKNATFETLIGVLKLIIQDIEKNVFIFEEGIRKTTGINTRNDLSIYEGAYKSGNVNRVNFEEKGGTIYIVLNKKLPKNLQTSIKNILLDVRAKGVEITIDFKYKIQSANYLCGYSFCGTTLNLDIVDSFYDEINQTKNYETNLARINVITQEGVR